MKSEIKGMLSKFPKSFLDNISFLRPEEFVGLSVKEKESFSLVFCDEFDSMAREDTESAWLFFVSLQFVQCPIMLVSATIEDPYKECQRLAKLAGVNLLTHLLFLQIEMFYEQSQILYRKSNSFLFNFSTC